MLVFLPLGREAAALPSWARKSIFRLHRVKSARGVPPWQISQAGKDRAKHGLNVARISTEDEKKLSVLESHGALSPLASGQE